MYIEKVAKRVVDILETRFITGPDLPIDDYTASINISSEGIRLDGNVSFHSAFVARIGAIELNMQGFREIRLDTHVAIEASLLWRNIGVALDFYADFNLPLNTRRDFATGEVTGSLHFMSINSQNDIVVVGHPNNGYVQMIARGITTNFAFRDHMLEPFRRWNFQNLLNVALAEIPYPEVCYNC
ncbi:hypothetical protein pipiens_014876 [Culex pipiens pipiens]|uniref:Uncharacterized protein n=1 Tax=Culex pipiens pipiens TaxID=38569 RepID=A0ABD1CSR9_CULPP